MNGELRTCDICAVTLRPETPPVALCRQCAENMNAVVRVKEILRATKPLLSCMTWVIDRCAGSGMLSDGEVRGRMKEIRSLLFEVRAGACEIYGIEVGDIPEFTGGRKS